MKIESTNNPSPLGNPNFFAATQTVSATGGSPAPIGLLYAQLYEQAQAVVGPVLTQSYSALRTDYLNFNDVAVARALQYRLNRRSTILDPAHPLLFGPVRLSMPQLLTLFSQMPWHRYDNDPAARFGLWKELEDELRWLGIRLDLPNNADAFDPSVNDWTRLIEFSAQAVPLGQAIANFRRGFISEGEFHFNVQRAGYRRQGDRDQLLNPTVAWSASDAIRLFAAGFIDADTKGRLVSASGVVRDEDAEILSKLSRGIDQSTVIGMLQKGLIDEQAANQYLALGGVINDEARSAVLRSRFDIPSATELQQWSMRGIWDEAIARTYGLDEGYDDSPVAKYFTKVNAANGDPVRLPGQPDGLADWAALTYRAQRPLPGFETALQMQYRLRPSSVNPEDSVIPGVATWLPENTADMLRLQGFTEPIIKQLMGLADQPINIRIINEILTEAVKHVDVAADAQAAYGDGVDWVKGSFLDHGFSDRVAQLAGDAIRAKADDQVHAEKIAEQKRLRSEFRDLTLKRYAGGFIAANAVVALIVGEQFDVDMATQAMATIDAATELALAESHLAAVKEGFLAGKLSLDQVGAQLQALGISDFMVTHYVQEWTWKRGDNPRVLSTEQILNAVKRGMMTPQIALVRLTNLGWTQPDALIEIAQVEQELQAAAAHQQSAAAAKAAAAQLKQQRAEASAARAAEKLSRQESAAAAKLGKQTEAAPSTITEQLAAYDAAALLDRDAYNKAIKAGDANKAQAEIDKAIAAYAKLINEQLSLASESPEIAREIPRPVQISIPETPPGQGVSEATTSASSPPGGSANESGGAGASSGPG